jgi:hypothetical protein
MPSTAATPAVFVAPPELVPMPHSMGPPLEDAPVEPPPQ